MQVKIRKAKAGDISAVVELALKLMKSHLKFDSFYYKLGKNATQEYAKYFKRIVRSKNWLLVVAEQDNTLLGYALATIAKRPTIYKLKKMCEFHDLFLEKKFRGKGISKKLFGEVKKFAKTKKIKLIRVRVDERNQRAIKAYKKFGFKEHDKNMIQKT